MSRRNPRIPPPPLRYDIPFCSPVIMWQPPHTSYVNSGAKTTTHFPARLLCCHLVPSDLVFLNRTSDESQSRIVGLRGKQTRKNSWKRLYIILKMTKFGTDILNKEKNNKTLTASSLWWTPCLCSGEPIFHQAYAQPCKVPTYAASTEFKAWQLVLYSAAQMLFKNDVFNAKR